MSFIKYNSAQCETTIKEIDSLNSEFDALKGLLDGFSANKISEQRSYVPSTNPDGTETTSQDMALLSKINAFNAAVAKISDMSNIISGADVKEKIAKVKDALVKVNEAVVEFNSTSISLKDALGSKEGITIEGEVVYFSVGDNKYRLGDLVNCFYTEIGMNMNSAIAIGVLADGKTDIDVDKMIKAAIESNDTFTNDLLGAGYFGVASLSHINELAEAAGVSADMSKDVASILGGMDLSKLNVEDMSDAELEILKQALAGKTGSALTLSGAGLASVMLAAYGMNNPSKGEENATEVPTTPEEENPNDPPGGGSYGGGSTEAPTTLFEFVEISSEPIPEPIVIEMDFDELALEKFEALGEEQLNKLYSDVTSEVMNLFDSENKTALIEKLSKYGYSQSDIDMIILDREMAINACIAGERRTLLAEFANELAKEGGFTDFESSYSGELKYGINDSSDYVYALGDKDVAEAYEGFTAARAEYYESVSNANTSIAAVETAKTELETLKAELIKNAGDDTTKWTEEDVNKYNAAVTKYNTALQTSIDSVKATEELKVKYESSKEDYMDAREEYIEELESLSNNIGSGSAPEVEYGGINTGVSGPVIEGVDYIAQAASDTIQTQINNTEVIENVSTNITDAISKSETTINNNFNNSTGIVTDTAASVEVLDLPVLNNAISNPTTDTTSGDSTFETPSISIKL